MPIKIALVTHGYPPEVVGGTERYVQSLAADLRRRRHDVRVFSGSIEWRSEFQTEDEVVDDIPVRRVHREDLFFDRWDKAFHPGVSREFLRFLEEFRPDVVHLHHWIRLSSDLVAVAAEAKIPSVVSLHDLYPSCPRVFRLIGDDGTTACEAPMSREACVNCVPRWRFQGDEEVGRRIDVYRNDSRSELRLAQALVAPSRTHGEFLRRMLSFSDAPILCVPHGTLSKRPEDSPPRGTDRLEVVYWSHLLPLKGAHLLLEAAKRSEHRDRFRIHLYGEAVDASYKGRLDALAEGLDVRFHGRFSPHQLAKQPMDVAVFPTLCRESYSFILDEAVHLGVPILAAATGALAERATSRVVLFERNNAVDLARRLDELAENPGRLAAMRNASPPALTPFEAHVDQIQELYHRVIGVGPPTVDGDARLSGRLEEEWRRRETWFKELVRIERWEDVVAEQRTRIEQLESRVRELEEPPRDG